MIDTIYVERDIQKHPRSQRILDRFPDAIRIEIDTYGEVFNRRSQNFRLQKRKPALILAAKHSGQVLPAPPGYGIGSAHNYYFSHMLNCLYDCRYCFLQGLFQSAHYVLFVNYEAFLEEIEKRLAEHEGTPMTFFSGYDCDSLALESVTGFVTEVLPFFRTHPQAILELRTKSIQIQPLLKEAPLENGVVAFSLTPHRVAQRIEHRAPSVRRRIEAMTQLAHHGWSIGLRFDPLIHGVDWQEQYLRLFDEVFQRIPSQRIHSVSYGPMRFPKAMFRDIARLYPQEPLFAASVATENGMASYPQDIEDEMTAFCRKHLQERLPSSIFFQCIPESR
ncbi:MAG: DNA photolyase [Planctomycetota bacterium]|nr:DNA photolyase [Planctomycetota bacterium]